ncbi:hypothetical protein J1G42_02855 [Cellulomonas sp. zg-ZUI222]|uniref:DUF5668 domain-containing protein n=1 Tax=Cellulomonas wangleii TaxID=2816956 RepID=A0ABX8D4Z7_9CELL|nr:MULTISPECIES: hypothetical protein [Cellulomonas]MBO0898902.1 hypothetical protein [Cellulomonas sp. zg-ZUI22]MBO0919764.1 hypothetical protein [Cellulomonas wangleii]MBO0923811.1 hypothetical protein [Cellulomonas wangleii]MBO0924093.1 hypothetical protein [Cellulomonas wangleii]QVI62118.1 hypothetical protein KG103_17160 [Cellulomonas wangleii]
MPGPRPPVLPRVGFALLTILLLLALVAFVVLFVVVPDERWTFLWPMVAMLVGLTWVRGARRTWVEKHRPATAPVDTPPTGLVP